MKKYYPEIIYTPQSQLRHPKTFFSRMFIDLKASRGLAWRFFVRNISAKYRQTLLGYFWVFFPPIITTATFVFLNSQKIIKISQTSIPYPVFVFVGTLLWQLFVDALNSPLVIVNQSKSFLTKINFPRESLILAGIFEVLFDSAIRLLLLFFVFFWFEISIPTSIFLAPIGFFSILLLGITIGIFLVPLGVLYHDVESGLRFLCSIWLFLTPVVYPLPQDGLIKSFSILNPVTPLLITTRNLLTGGDILQIGGFTIVSICSLILLFFGWVLYRLALPHLIARISS